MNTDQVGRVIVIRYKGKMYDHYGILDGYNNVIHVHKKKGMITSDPLDRVLNKAIKVSYLDDEFSVRWLNYHNAKLSIGSSHTYKFFTNSCEHWVNKIRKGEAYSKQLNQATDMVSTSILLLVGILSIGDSLSLE